MERISENQCPWCGNRQAIVRDGVFICPRCSYEKDISGPHEVKVIGWTTGDDNGYQEIGCGSRQVYDAIVTEIREKGYLFGAMDHDGGAHPCNPVINNGFKVSCGQRFWAKLMACAHEGQEGKAGYMNYYGFLDNAVYPPAGVDREQIIPFELEA